MIGRRCGVRPSGGSLPFAAASMRTTMGLRPIALYSFVPFFRPDNGGCADFAVATMLA